MEVVSGNWASETAKERSWGSRKESVVEVCFHGGTGRNACATERPMTMRGVVVAARINECLPWGTGYRLEPRTAAWACFGIVCSLKLV